MKKFCTDLKNLKIRIRFIEIFVVIVACLALFIPVKIYVRLIIFGLLLFSFIMMAYLRSLFYKLIIFKKFKTNFDKVTKVEATVMGYSFFELDGRGDIFFIFRKAKKIIHLKYNDKYYKAIINSDWKVGDVKNVYMLTLNGKPYKYMLSRINVENINRKIKDQSKKIKL